MTTPASSSGFNPLSRRQALRLLSLSAVVLAGCATAISPRPSVPSSPASDGPPGIQIGIAFATRAADLAGIKAGGVGYVFGGRAPIEGVKTAFVTNGHRDQAPGHDLAWYEANRPDWIVYRPDGLTPALDSDARDAGQVTIDISNPEVVQYQFDAFLRPAIDRGFRRVGLDGVFIVNPARWGGVYRAGQWTRLYSGDKADSTLRQAVLDWAKALRDKIKAYDREVALDMNYSLRKEDPASYEQLLPYLDGVFDERGFTNWGSPKADRSTDQEWLRLFQAMRKLAGLGKLVFLNGQAPVADPGTPATTYAELRQSILASQVPAGDVDWVLSNYLLVKAPDFYTNVSAFFERTNFQGHTQGAQDYGRYVDRPEYHWPVGSPLGEPYEQAGVYRRDYSGATVMVNPSSGDTARLSLEGRDVTLAPASGTVVLKAS